MGAWIENDGLQPEMRADAVAPHVGAWIETIVYRLYDEVNKSHPTWVRGLKLLIGLTLTMLLQSHPTWVRGLKPWATEYCQ